MWHFGWRFQKNYEGKLRISGEDIRPLNIEDNTVTGVDVSWAAQVSLYVAAAHLSKQLRTDLHTFYHNKTFYLNVLDVRKVCVNV